MTTAAETWDAIFRSDRAARSWPSEDVIRFAARRLKAEARVLEVGCGTGANTWFLARQRYALTATDISSVAIAGAVSALHKQNGRDFSTGVAFYPAELGSLSRSVGIPLNHYDAIVDCRVSQHTRWSEHLAIYREYCELLKPGGWLFLFHLDANTSDARRNDDLRTEGERFTWDDIETGAYPHNGLVCMPPPEELGGCLAAAGFTLARAEIVQRLEEGVIVSHTAFDARRPA